MGLADFDINATPPVDGNGDRLFIATPGQLITCTLTANPGGVLSVRFDLVDPTNTESPLASKDAPLVTWVENSDASQLLTGINDDATFNMPGADVHSYIVRCTVSTANGPVVFERIVSTLAAVSLLRKTIPTESVQAHARGVSDDLNDLVDAAAAALVDPTLKPPEAFAAAGTYPVTYDGDAIAKGDTFRITGAGTMGAVTVNVEDLLIALVDTPAQTDGNWMVVESNRDQATETVKGVAELATQAEADAGTDDTRIITPLKLANFPFPPGGEVNTGSSLGGGAAVFKTKSGVDLQFRSLVAGANIALTENANDVAIVSGPPTVVVKSQGDDGDTLAANVMNIASGGGGDYGLKLPSVTGLPVNSRCYVFSFVGAAERVVMSVETAGTVIFGDGAGGVADIALCGTKLYVFRFAGTAAGPPGWLLETSDGFPSAYAKPAVQLATNAVLDAATLSLAGVFELLTRTGNGALTVDSVAAVASLPSSRGILVKDEVGVPAKNGIWQVLDIGSGGTPWILRRRCDWNQDGHMINGALITVLEGTANGGLQFAALPGLAVGGHVVASFVALGSG